jgi:hypothetical protein
MCAISAKAGFFFAYYPLAEANGNEIKRMPGAYLSAGFTHPDYAKPLACPLFAARKEDKPLNWNVFIPYRVIIYEKGAGTSGFKFAW